MTLITDIHKAEKLHQLIQAGHTGTPKELANLLKVDRVTLHMMIEELNALNLTVSYSRKYETFYYKMDKE